MNYLIKNANIFTAAETDFETGYLQIKNGKIEAIGDMTQCPPAEGYTVLDACGKNVYPGFIDAHCHLGICEDSIGFEGEDCNEMTNPCTPQMRAIDAINPCDRCFTDALAAGVTAVVTGPGSGNPIGGQSAAIKTVGKCIDDMILKAPLAMKMAFGENPKTVYNERKQTPMSRMGTAAIIREALEKTKRYMEKKDADFDAKLEALIPVLKGEIPIHTHAHRADDIFTAVRIAKEYNLNYVLVHCTEGYLIADELAKAESRIISGPVLGDRCKPELRNQTAAGPGIAAKAGVQVAICTDHPVIPIQYLPISAGLCVREGMDYRAALKAITIVPACHMGFDQRIGSLEVGKDADFSIYSGDALEMSGKCMATFVNGEKVFEHVSCNFA
ncbi:MAG: amidohydrolase [Oscillospiraceae bacterium]|nr:amidohydrolase [Oscillospiraceae bacterium]